MCNKVYFLLYYRIKLKALVINGNWKGKKMAKVWIKCRGHNHSESFLVL